MGDIDNSAKETDAKRSVQRPYIPKHDFDEDETFKTASLSEMMKASPDKASRGELEDGGLVVPISLIGDVEEPTLEGLPEVCDRCKQPVIIINLNSRSDVVVCDNYKCPKFREPGYYVPKGTRKLWLEKKRSEKLRSTITGIKKKAAESGHTKKISDLVARLKGG